MTVATGTDPDSIRALLPAIRARGHAETDSTFEPGVHGIALPLFDAQAACAGSIAVATPTARMTEDQRRLTLAELAKAAAEITRAWGGQLPPGPDFLN
jgi:DNA-binding IclR family transcriptional regulator